MTLTTYAQNNGIQLYLYAPNQMENIPPQWAICLII